MGVLFVFYTYLLAYTRYTHSHRHHLIISQNNKRLKLNWFLASHYNDIGFYRYYYYYCFSYIFSNLLDIVYWDWNEYYKIKSLHFCIMISDIESILKSKNVSFWNTFDLKKYNMIFLKGKIFAENKSIMLENNVLEWTIFGHPNPTVLNLSLGQSSYGFEQIFQIL